MDNLVLNQDQNQDLNQESKDSIRTFNWNTYLRFNKDLIPHIKSEDEALSHYEQHGAKEGRLRSFIEFYNKFPLFNSELYRQSHSDLVLLDREDLISHYWYNGQYENRIIVNDKDIINHIPNFDINFYRNHYEDLKHFSDTELLAHFLVHGKVQGRLKNSFELEVQTFLSNYDNYVIVFSRIEEILDNNKPMIYSQIDEPLKSLEADIYTDLTTELARFSKLSENNRVAVFVIDFYLNLRTDEYKKSHEIPDNVSTVFSFTKPGLGPGGSVGSRPSGHFYIRSENLGVIDQLNNPKFILVRGNNSPMIKKLGNYYNKSTKIFYPATSLTYQKNKHEKNIVQAANYQLYNNAAGYDIILVDDRHILEYMKKTKISDSKLVLFTKYAPPRWVHLEDQGPSKSLNPNPGPNPGTNPTNAIQTVIQNPNESLDTNSNQKFDLLFTSYTKGPTKNFHLFSQFISYLQAKNSDISVLVLNKENNDDLDNLRKINYAHLKIIITSTPDSFYDLCYNHIITSGRDAQPRTLSETLSKGLHNIVLDTLTNGIYIIRDNKIFGTIIPTKKTFKGKHYIPVPDKALFEQIEVIVKQKKNHQRIRNVSYDVLSREKLILDLIGKVYPNRKFVVTFATVDYSNMASLLINSIIKTNPDVVTIVFCVNWEPQVHQLFIKHYAAFPVLFVPYSVHLPSKNDVLKTKVRIIHECYHKLEQDFIWIDADSIVLSSLQPLFNLFDSQKQILVFLRPESKNEFEKVALGVIGFSGRRLGVTGIPGIKEHPENKAVPGLTGVTVVTVVKEVTEGTEGTKGIKGTGSTEGTKSTEGTEGTGRHEIKELKEGHEIKEGTEVHEIKEVKEGTEGHESLEGNDNPVCKFLNLWISKVEKDPTTNSNDWFSDQIGFYRSLGECSSFLNERTIHCFTNNEHSINGEENTIIYSRRRHNKRSICTIASEKGINSTMLTVPGVKYAYIDQTVDHYSLFFVTYDYPSNGGAATNLYAIYKLYRQMGVTACIAFINEQPIPTELQMEFQKDPNIFFFSSSNMNLAGPKEILQKKKFKVLIFKIYKTLSTLEENGLNTSLFKKIIYLCSGLSTYAPPKNMVKDADSYNNKRRMELYPITKSHKVIFNSELTRSLYHNMIADNDNSDINNKKTLVVNTTLLGMNKDDFVFENNNKFEDRDIDLIFVVSDCCRKVKNASLVYQLYKRPEMKELKKWIIGLNADMSLASLPNTNIINHNLTRMEVIKYLKNSKILLLPSHFDSSPNILYEGLLSGCNVIASKNIGNIEIIPNENIVQIEMNAAKDAAKFATLVPDNLKEWKCKEPSLNAEPKKILDDLILLD